MKKYIGLFIFIVIDIILLILLISSFSKENVLIEDRWIKNNHYVGTILTSKGNIYYIDSKLKEYKNLNDNSSYLLSHYKRKETKMTNQDFNKIKTLLKEIKNSHNSICEYTNSKNNDRILIYYDYDINKKIILADNSNCENKKIINIIQKYGMWLSDN